MNRPGGAVKFFTGFGMLLRGIPVRVGNFFRIRPGTGAGGRSSRDTQILVGKIGIVVCVLVAVVFVVFGMGLFSSSTPVTITPGSAAPSASGAIVANHCDTAPVATPSPEPSATPVPIIGDPCSYLSGIVVIYNSAADPSAAAPIGGQSISAALTNIDGGGRLPADSLRNTSSNTNGQFSLPVYTGGSWRVFYSRPVNGGVTQSFPITVISVLDGPPSAVYGPGWAPSCDSATSGGQDASFHFAGDTRLVMAISVCPSAIIATVVSIEIPRIPFVEPSVPPVYNPVSVTLNFANELRYSVAVAQADRIAQIQSGSSGSLLPPALLLAGTALWAGLAYWVKVRMRNIDKMPEARFDDDRQF
jgi:hypothetical protein